MSTECHALQVLHAALWRLPFAPAMFSWPWSRWREHRIERLHPIDDALWCEAVEGLPVLDRLLPDELCRLRRLASVFLHDKVFDPVKGASIDRSFTLHVAIQACLPILHLGMGWYRGWSSIIVYPDQFVAPYHAIDTSGIYHEWEQAASGQAWVGGPVIFSLADVEASGQGRGFNVIIHEMAHQLDMLSGGPNGCPPLHRDMDRANWHRALEAAYQHLNLCLDKGLATDIDAYAATDPGEFFAVCSETFFERPDVLARCYGGVYRQFASFYRQDPMGTRRDNRTVNLPV